MLCYASFYENDVVVKAIRKMDKGEFGVSQRSFRKFKGLGRVLAGDVNTVMPMIHMMPSSDDPRDHQESEDIWRLVMKYGGELSLRGLCSSVISRKNLGIEFQDEEELKPLFEIMEPLDIDLLTQTSLGIKNHILDEMIQVCNTSAALRRLKKKFKHQIDGVLDRELVHC